MHTSLSDNKQVLTEIDPLNDECEALHCRECNLNFTERYYLYKHLLYHVQQPFLVLDRVRPAPIRITVKTKNNSFEIINKSNTASATINSRIEGNAVDIAAEERENVTEDKIQNEMNPLFELKVLDNSDIETIVSDLNPSGSRHTNDQCGKRPNLGNNAEYIPGAEPTPPPEPSPDYPKIRIKTMGLLKDSVITEDNSNINCRVPEIVDVNSTEISGQDSNYASNQSDNLWSGACLEDPLRLPDSNDKADNNHIANFLNDNEQVNNSESEYISLDRLDNRNRNAMQVYNPVCSKSQNALDQLTGLPMQQLAQQVSRLQPSSSSMHQQNVLINIQQFPQQASQPMPPAYQPPPMYPPHPGMPGQPPPMYPQYQYQPPNHIYYPPTTAYPSHMGPNQMPQPAPPSMQQQQQPPLYRPPPPRQHLQQQPTRPPFMPRQPMNIRPRAPMVRPRGAGANIIRRGPRPRLPPPAQNMQRPQNVQFAGGPRVVKQSPETMIKRKRLDLFDKDDDPDCQIIATQPKNTDGGLPQITSVQGATETMDNSVMHLSDSITLSVRNPPPRTESPQKSDAKAVANILATRGITVTASAKPKEKPQSSITKIPTPPPTVALNLNNAVSIIPTAKNSTVKTVKSPEGRLQTVDLTDDGTSESASRQTKPPVSPQKANQRSLPFRCDLCPAQYPNSMGLSKHRQSYHKTGSACDIGVPLIDLKQPGIAQKLSSLGIYNYIPLLGSSPDGNFALPVVSMNAVKNSSVCNLNALGASSVLTLGPVRSLPRPQQNSINANHK